MVKRHTKKIASMILVCVMLAGLMGGCGNSAGSNTAATSQNTSGSSTTGSSDNSTDSSTNSSTNTTDSTDGTASDEKEVITIGLSQNSNVEDYDTNYLTALLEEKFNVDIQFVFLPSASEDAKVKFALLTQTGSELPDILLFEQFTSLEIVTYGSKGIFIPLNDYFANATYFNQVDEDARNKMLQTTTSPDGNIYSLSKTYLEPWNETPYRFWINQAWLDTLGLSMPTTTEEFYEVAKAFATEDPNGNGVNDEIAITGSTGGWGTNPFYYFMNSFTFCDDHGLQLADDGTTVVAPFTTNEWYEGLVYMNKLCEEGLLSPSIFTQDGSQLTATLSNETQIVGSTAAGGTGYWSESTANPNFQEMAMLAPLTGPEGVSYAAYTEAEPKPIYFITKDCEDPELAFAIGDYFYNSDISFTGRYGEKDVDWSSDESVVSSYKGMYEDKLGIDCKFAILNVVWSTVQNKHWYNCNPGYLGVDTIMSLDQGESSGGINYTALTRSDSYDLYYSNHPDVTLPTLIYTQEEADELAEIQENVTSYVDTAIAEFITGNRPLSDWDNYLEELESLGLQTWIDYSQNAYDRMTSN